MSVWILRELLFPWQQTCQQGNQFHAPAAPMIVYVVAIVAREESVTDKRRDLRVTIAS